MAADARNDIKLGFYVGIGVVLALLVWGVGTRLVGKGIGG